MPSYKDYWINDNIFKNSIRSIMTLYSYENINSFIHPEPVNLKGNNKILNSIKIIIFKSQKYYYPNYYVTIDEKMFSFRDKNENVVYENEKPIKLGFRPIF